MPPRRCCLLSYWCPWCAVSRLATQGFAATAAILVGTVAGVTGVWLVDALITFICIVAVTNAFNMIDSMDGLSAGIATVSCAVVAVGASWNGQEAVAATEAAVAAASRGYLAFNLGGASLFMGDAGSMFLGFMVAICVIELDPTDTSRTVSLIVSGLFLLVPALDLCTVTVSRRRRVSVASGGTDHLSHRLVQRGLTRPGAVAFLVLVQTRCDHRRDLRRTLSSAPGMRRRGSVEWPRS